MDHNTIVALVSDLVSSLLQPPGGQAPESARLREDLGGTDTTLRDLRLAIEQHFHLSFSDQQFARLSTISDVVGEIELLKRMPR